MDLGYYYLLFIIYSYFVMATGDHPQEDDQAIFGYRPDIKISQKFMNPLYFGYTCWNLFYKSGKLGLFLLMKILCMCRNHIFQVKKRGKKKSPTKKNSFFHTMTKFTIRLSAVPCKISLTLIFIHDLQNPKIIPTSIFIKKFC